MYNFQARRKTIIAEGKKYGVTLTLVDNGSLHGVLQFGGEYHGSQSVERSLQRMMKTYNEHSRKGM